MFGDEISDDVLADFLAECRENFDALDNDLIRLESEGVGEALDDVFRSIHTIKGSAGLLQLPCLESVTHAAENLLGRIRDRTLAVTRERIDGLLDALVVARLIVHDIEHLHREGDHVSAALLDRLEALGEPGRDEADAGAAPPEAAGEVRVGELLVREGLLTPAMVERAAAAQAGGDRRRLGEILVAQGAISIDQLVETLVLQSRRLKRHEPRPDSGADPSVRVPLSLLDEMGDLVTELLRLAGDGELASRTAQVETLGAELRDRVLQARLQPVDQLFRKLPRLVRDVAHACGKEADLIITGEDVELDRSLIEALRDPLTHLVRNAVDHGLEAPQARVLAGKAPRGRLTVAARATASHVVVEVGDDGAGIDIDALARRARSTGLLAPDDLDGLARPQLLELVFRPGFSTADAVSTISGRGVGLDVVATNVHALGGAVEVASTAGEGTTFRMLVPRAPGPVPGAGAGCPRATTRSRRRARERS